MDRLGELLLDGLAIGSIYALIALGYTMVYGVIKLINFAHGEFYMAGGYIAYFTLRGLSGLREAGVENRALGFLVESPVASFLLALVAAMAGAAVLAVVVERLAYRPLRTPGMLSARIPVVTTIIVAVLSALMWIGPKSPMLAVVVGLAAAVGCANGVIALVRVVSLRKGIRFVTPVAAAIVALECAWAAFGLPLAVHEGTLGIGDVVRRVLVAAVFGAVAGAVVLATKQTRVERAGRIAALLTALGMSLFLQNIAVQLFGAERRVFPITFGERKQAIVPVTVAVLMVALTALVRYTRFGKAMRALAFDPDAARLVGVRTDRVISLTFFVGGALAGGAGALIGGYYSVVDPLIGFIPGLKAFIAAVVGGIGNIPGAVVGGFVMGLSETLAGGVFAEKAYTDLVAFGLLIIILLVRPTGILGRREVEKV